MANYVVRIQSGESVILRRVNVEHGTERGVMVQRCRDSSLIHDYFQELLWTVLDIVVDDGSLDVKYQTVFLGDE